METTICTQVFKRFAFTFTYVNSLGSIFWSTPPYLIIRHTRLQWSLVANPCRSDFIAHMAADGVFSTPSDAILRAIYADQQGASTRGADLERISLTKWRPMG